MAVIAAVAGYLESQQSPEEFLAAQVAEANKQCPMKVDDDTRLDEVSSGPGMRLEYSYTTVNAAKEDLDLELLATNLRKVLTDQTKTAEEMGPLREMKVTFVYTYSDKNGKPLTSIEIGPAVYGASQADPVEGTE